MIALPQRFSSLAFSLVVALIALLGSDMPGFAGPQIRDVSARRALTLSLTTSGMRPLDADPLMIDPGSANVFQSGSKSFTPSGGDGNYFWSFTQNNSNGTIDQSGNYTAGTHGGVIDTIQIIDTTDGTLVPGTANITVGPSLAINTPTHSAPPNGTINFTSNGGGSGTGYAWTLSQNQSGGTIDPALGTYTAGPNPNTTDIVELTDSLNNTAFSNVSVGSGITINPSAPTPPPRGPVSLVASGGSGTGYAWTFVQNQSGASLNGGTGAYVAGVTGSTTDVVQVVDSVHNSAQVTISVGPGLSITPSAPSIAPQGTINFGSSGGSGSGNTWTLTQNQSGGHIGATTGVYVAGVTGSKTDIAQVQDSLGNTASVTITVTAGVTVSPPAPTTPPKGAIVFTPSGGTGSYTFAFVANASGGTLDTAGNYQAGPTGSVTDKIKCTDTNNNVANVNITVGAKLAITPPTPSTPPLGSITFSTTGGSNMGVTWSVSVDNSGGAFVGNVYTAGATGSVVDTVMATDSLGNTATVNVSVGGGLSINPSGPSVAPKGSVSFSANGGSGMGKVWSFVTNASGGTISAAGAYKAGATGNVVDTVQVKDSLGNVATTTVTVGPAVTITPNGGGVAPLGAMSFGAAGGSGTSFAWTLMTNASGGSIGGATGAYKAGTTGSVTDVVKVTDSLGNVATVNVAVSAAVALSPTSTSLPPKGSVKINASGGAGGYTFTLQTNASGANVSASGGAYTAGAVGSVTDVVKVTDANGATATASVVVGAVVKITPQTPSAPPLATVSFSATGGSGTGYVWSLTVNASGGAMNASSGLYRAGADGSTTDHIGVVDSLGNTASATVAVGGSLIVIPSDVTTQPRGKYVFAAQGGSGTGYTWSLSASPSGGTIDALTGSYTAGSTGSVADVIEVTDSLGQTATGTVSVTASLAIAPPTANVDPGGAVSFSAAGGSGAGYAYGISTNASGAVIDDGGNYVAGTSGSGPVTDVVTLTDSFGNTSNANVTVNGADAGPPDTGDEPPPPVVIPESDRATGCSAAPARLGGDGAGDFAGLLLAFAAAVAAVRRRR